jgi:hypothetical protein
VRRLRKIVALRDWFLNKVTYLQEESAKWRTAFTILKSPYSLLRMMGLNPQVAISLLIAAPAISTGVVVAEVMDGKSFQRGDPGVYLAPQDAPIRSGSNNTLRIDLGTTPVGEIIIRDVTVGTAFPGSTLPLGETDVVFLGGSPADGSFVETFIEVGHLTIDRWRCTQLTLSDIEVHTLNVKFNASDGQSVAPVPGTPRNIRIGGGNRASSMVTSGGLYDQILIQAPNSGVNGQVDVMTLSNIFSAGGPCVLSRIKAGQIDVLFNEVGFGDGLALKDLIIADTVIYKNFVNEDNIEVAIAPP